MAHLGADSHDALGELARRAAETTTTQLVVLHGGAPLWSTAEAGHDGLLHTQSVTKLVLNVVLARAAALGHIGSVDDPVHRWLPDWATRRRKRVLLRHLMGHTSGLSCDWQELRTADPDDWVSYCRALPVSAEPGEVAAYNNGAVMLLPAIVAAAVGRPFLDFVAEEIFGPLGIPDFTWGTDRAGNPFGMSHLQLRGADLARVGQLLLQRGRWQGRQLFDETWLDTCLAPSHPSAPRFGLLLFRYPNLRSVGGFGHDGDGGQHLWIYPGSQLVVARLRRMDAPFDGPDCGFLDLPNLALRLSP